MSALESAVNRLRNEQLRRAFPHPDTCPSCKRYLERGDLGAPDHDYALGRGHKPHCTCDGCF